MAPKYQRKAATAATKGNDMTDKDKGVPAASVEQIAAARAEGFAEGEKSGIELGTTNERARVKRITADAAAQERPALAAHLAFETQMDPEAAIALLAKAAPEASAKPANALDAKMRALGNPVVGQDGEGAAAKSEPKIVTANVYALRAEAVAKSQK